MSNRRKKIGLAPGSVIFTGDRKVDKVLIHYMQYDEENTIDKEIDSHSENIFNASPLDKVNWYDVRGIHDTKLIELFGKNFSIHPIIYTLY